MSLDYVQAILEERERVLNKPSDTTTIWRYYSVEKFLHLITSKELYFSSAESFEDPFEGDYGTKAKYMIREIYGEEQYVKDLNTYEFLKKHTYISCWYESENESDAMWKIYGNGIAVKSRFGHISKLLPWSEDELRHAGRINYIDYDNDNLSVNNSYLPYFYKRKAFSHEREVRFLIQNYNLSWDHYPKPSLGKNINLDINNSIEEIVFSPIMPEFVKSSLETIIKKLDFTVPIRHSSLLTKPIW
ncbi:hypothetical protein [Aeromonas enteropelogenes]|uniref:hypothetical protein n=1 Tax=Aeromonas enteropelogenes TaxID=29489 RepID=UPI003B9EAB81